jgi:hypothetical protein
MIYCYSLINGGFYTNYIINLLGNLAGMIAHKDTWTLLVSYQVNCYLPDLRPIKLVTI